MSVGTDRRRSFEELEVGEAFRLGPYPMSEKRIIEFARSFDPQPMHLDSGSGQASPLGGLAASGWHTASVAMRLVYDAWLRTLRGAGSPGIERNEWPRALMAGETVQGDGRLLSKRVLRTRPGTGVAHVELSLQGSKGGAEVLRARWWVFFERNSRDSSPERLSEPDQSRARPERTPPPRLSDASVPDLRMLHLGGVERGETVFLGEVAANTDEILSFARSFDPQPFHVDPLAAEDGPFRGLCASGWHTCSLWMRANVRARQRILASLDENERRQLEHSAAVGLGFDDLSWTRPVRPDQRLLAFITALESRESRSRPGWGIARWRAEITDDDENLVLRFHPSLLMKKP